MKMNRLLEKKKGKLPRKICSAGFSFVFVVVFFPFVTVTAQTYSSPTFRIFQPATNESVTSTSNNFQLIGTVSQVTILPTRTAGPTISNVEAYLTSSSGAVVTWKTDIVASSTLSWGSAPSTFDNSTSSSAMTIEHALKMSNLSSGTTYYYKVISYDSLGNASTSDNGGPGFSLTTASSEQTTVAVSSIVRMDNRDLKIPEISNIKIINITDTEAVVSFTTSKITNEIVKIGDSLDTTYGTTTVYQTSHNVPLRGLTPSTSYPFIISVSDIYENSASSNLEVFKTLDDPSQPATSTAFSSTVPRPATTSPVVVKVPAPISAESSSSISSFGDLVRKGTTAFLDRAIDVFFSSIRLNPLAKKVDETSFVASVSEAAERIVLPPTISGLEAGVQIGQREAIISWSTDKLSNSLVAYAKSSEFDASKENPYSIDAGFPDEETLSHKVTLINLEPSTTYHYKIRSQGKIGPTAESEDKIFTTLSQSPEIADAKFKKISDGETVLEWQTNLPTKTRAVLEMPYTGETRVIEDESFLKVHELAVPDLVPSSSYTLRLQAVDEFGNTSESSILPFSTAQSVTPPKISQVKITTSLISDRVEAVQTIISWKTDKHGNSKVYFAEGNMGDLSQATPIDPTYVKDHVVITTALKPGSIYQIRVESEDAQGRKGISSIYTVMTPSPRRSAVDLIVENMETTFGIFKRR